MNCYVDTSVILRVLLSQDGRWEAWGRWEKAYCSSIMRVECARVVDRLRLQRDWNDHQIAHVGQELRRLQRFVAKAALTSAVLTRAALPMPTTVKSLDAIHIATALLIRERLEPDLVFVTHHEQQSRAAQALGFECLPMTREAHPF